MRFLMIDNHGRSGVTAIGSTNLPADDSLNVILAQSAILQPTTPVTFAALEANSTTQVLTAPGQPLQITVQQDAAFHAGSLISVDSQGSAGTSAFGDGHGGGGYGGAGGAGLGGPGGAVHGSMVQPTDYGSGSGSTGASGGGVMRLTIGGTLTVDGTVSANGGNGGGGGGGRIAIHGAGTPFVGSVAGDGGTGHASGGTGTIYWTGDINPDGAVDVVDLLMMIDNFGR